MTLFYAFLLILMSLIVSLALVKLFERPIPSKKVSFSGVGSGISSFFKKLPFGRRKESNAEEPKKLSQENEDALEKRISDKVFERISKFLPKEKKLEDKIVAKDKTFKEYFGKGIEELRGTQWDWEHFPSTKNYPVSSNLLDWVVGQDRALKECYLCLDEWVHKLKYLEHANWWDNFANPDSLKPSSKIPPGPYLLLLGDPGTGKSLIGKALAERLTEIYKKEDIKLFDVLSWKNKVVPSTPRISVHEAGEGKEIIIREKKKEAKKGIFTRWFFKGIIGLMLGLGTILLGFLAMTGISLWLNNSSGVQMFYDNFFDFVVRGIIMGNINLLLAAVTCLSMGGMLFIFSRFMGGMMGGSKKGIGGAESSDAPKILVTNSAGIAQFIDATGHSSAQLFGSIAWDPYQTGDLGTPEHQRVSAGDVHRACMGVLYIDEIKNLHPEEAITLLTVLEDGQLAITMRSSIHGSDTAAMAVSTEPVPAMVFLIGAGNFDSISQVHPALMDRIYGYGKVVRMNNDMPNSIENRRKYVQFISQETKRFNLMPFSREACIAVVDEGRRRSNKKYALTTKFRPLISIIKTASVLAMNDNFHIVEAKYVQEAIEVHCKTIQKQLLEHYMEEEGKMLDIDPKGSKLGQIYGMAVSQDPYSGEMAGTVTGLRASMVKKSKFKREKGSGLQGYYKVTGIAKESEQKYIGDSISKVRSVILQKYGVDIAQDYMTHIDFSQSYGIDGPSAGVTMTLLICSLLEGKPIRQDTAVTGEINVGVGDEIKITAVGGLYEKIKAAEKWGFKRVIIPKKNYEQSIDPRDYSIEIISGDTLDDYLKEILASEKEKK